MAHIENADLGVWNATAVAGLGVGLVPRLPAVADFMAEMHCAHVRSPGGVYLKCLCKPVYNCIYICVFWLILGVLAMCMFDFVWRIYETMLAEEVCFFIVVF